MKQIVVVGDAHLEHNQPKHPSYLLCKRFIKVVKPDLIVLIGDMLDFSYLGSYNETLEALREGKRLQNDFDLMNKELDFFQKYSTEVIYLEGNHEYRLTRYTETLPNLLEGLVSIKKDLKLEERVIKWVPQLEQPIKVGHLHFIHGFRCNIHATKSTIDDFGVNVVMGHIHRASSFIKTYYNRDPAGCWSIGCLCNKNPEWLNGKPNSWNNGFGIAYVKDDGNFNFYPINIINNSFIWAGKEWKDK